MLKQFLFYLRSEKIAGAYTLTQQNFNSALAHEIVNIDLAAAHLSELIDGVATVDVEQGHKRLKYVQMKRGCD